MHRWLLRKLPMQQEVKAIYLDMRGNKYMYDRVQGLWFMEVKNYWVLLEDLPTVHLVKVEGA